MPVQEVGFELDGDFYSWSVTDAAKDLMLIDRFTQMPVHEFFQVIESGFDRGRGPILLAMIATSVRAKHLDWSVDRIQRMVMDLSVSEVEFMGGEEDEDQVPPEEPPETAAEENSGTSSET